MLPGKSFVPAHYHITEVGKLQKDFIDCGGNVRSTTACLLQVWVAQNLDHRLETTKLASITRIAEPLLEFDELPVVIEHEEGVISQHPCERRSTKCIAVRSKSAVLGLVMSLRVNCNGRRNDASKHVVNALRKQMAL
jgi:hypothetical protein